MNAEEMKGQMLNADPRDAKIVALRKVLAAQRDYIDRRDAQIAVLREALEMFPYSHRARAALAASEPALVNGYRKAADAHRENAKQLARQFQNTNLLVKPEQAPEAPATEPRARNQSE